MSKDTVKNTNPIHPTAAAGGVINNPWRALRQFTDARIGLGRAGVSLPTSELLAFQLAHAQARDAVHTPLDLDELQQQLGRLNLERSQILKLHSQADDRTTYLQRPDFGRRLNETSHQALQHLATANTYDLAIVIVDGLSSKAVQQNAVPFIQTLLATLPQETSEPWTLAPIALVEQGRVAIGDEIGELVNAKTVIVLIGERPGLSSPDSLGLYLTWQPKVGFNDAQRNCISNIRPAGLSYPEAAHKTLYLLQEARRLKLSGVNLKDRSHETALEQTTEIKNFLLE